MSRNGDSLFALLVRAHAVAQALANDLLFECGVSVVEAWVLEEISPTAARCATDIARALGVPTSTVTRALRRLETYSYVTLAKGTFRDARVLTPELTAMGAGVRKHVLGFEHELDGMLLRDLRPVELGAFVVGLTRVAAHPRTVADHPVPPDPPASDLGRLRYESFAPRSPAATTTTRGSDDGDDEPPAAPAAIDPLSLF